MNYIYNERALKRAVSRIVNTSLLLAGGNGGSAEQASHFVAELTGSFEGLMNSFPAMSMCANTAEITAFANDFGYDNLFIRYFDVFEVYKPSIVLLTTSGMSKNVNNLIDKLLSIEYDHSTITLLTGKNDVMSYGDRINVITTGYDDTASIQECHMHILHVMASMLKNKQL